MKNGTWLRNVFSRSACKYFMTSSRSHLGQYWISSNFTRTWYFVSNVFPIPRLNSSILDHSTQRQSYRTRYMSQLFKMYHVLLSRNDNFNITFSLTICSVQRLNYVIHAWRCRLYKVREEKARIHQSFPNFHSSSEDMKPWSS